MNSLPTEVKVYHISMKNTWDGLVNNFDITMECISDPLTSFSAEYV